MAEQLGVDMLLQGEVLVHGEDLDARFRAFSAAGEKSWERRFSGTTTEVVAILDDVATAFANTVGAQSAVLEPPPSARTLQLYLKGMAYLEGWDVERNHELAEQALRQTIEEDDRFAEAHAGLSRALWKQYEETRRPALVREALAAAERAAAERAAELNPDLPQAHLASGIVQLGQGRTAESLASFALAQQLAPGDDAVCRRIAGAYANLGRDGEAESMYQRAIDLRPRYWENYNYKGVFYLDGPSTDEQA